MSRDQINIRCDREMKMYLLGMEDYSKYIRDLIDRDRLERLDNTFINSKIKEHQEAVKQLEGLKKAKPKQKNEVHEFLAYHSTNYKQNAPFRHDSQRYKFIEKAIIPTLKKYGYKKTPEEIDEILLNFPEG